MCQQPALAYSLAADLVLWRLKMGEPGPYHVRDPSEPAVALRLLCKGSSSGFPSGSSGLPPADPSVPAVALGYFYWTGHLRQFRGATPNFEATLPYL